MKPEANRVVLPCNGLDKEAGALAREVALALCDEQRGLICPVLYQRSPSRYERELEGKELLVIDGCKTACASKLARDRGLKIARRLIITELLKEKNLRSRKAPIAERERVELLVPRVLELLNGEGAGGDEEQAGDLFQGPVDFREFMEGKFVFRVPAAGYFFNENDCWARVEGSQARLGVSDYVQQSASDMLFFEPPPLGKELAIFDEAGGLESTKTALDIISPVSGTVVAINEQLVEAPEMINEDPYVRGWAVEVELSDFEGERSLLMDCDGYFEYLKAKVEREIDEQ